MQKVPNEALGRPDVEAFRESEKTPIVVVLDNVRSLANVGSAFRSGDAFAIEHLYLCGLTGHPPHREIEKSALGATQSVDWSHHAETTALLHSLKEQGYLLVAVEQTQPSTLLQDFQAPAGQKIALVFGHEVFGVADEVIAMCDLGLEIPQFGTKHSLNIAVSIGIVLWDLSCKIRF
jgi:tRNA G18 (ribose-2'-O)-methylase SpoU